MPPLINALDGTANLPNGVVITPRLTQDELPGAGLPASTYHYDRGTLPWVHYRFSGGEVEGRPLIAGLCFYDQLLIDLTLTADLYPSGSNDWSSYALETEAATKDFHDKLLTNALGPPGRSEPLAGHHAVPGTQTLYLPRRWDFAWGRVWSSHDFKGGGTSIILRYGDRFEEANTHYLAHHLGPDAG